MKLVLLICGWCLMTSLTFEATWYNLHGNLTASGERFDRNGMTCASNKFKLGTILKVTNLRNNKSVVVKVNDRGGMKPYIIDLSLGAFEKISELGYGRIKVNVEVIEKK